MTMIEGYIGLPGTGKTYSLTARVLEERKRFPERPIFTNYPVRGCTYFEPDDWLYLPPGLVVLDEAHLLFSARAAMRLPGEWLQTISQTRKRGWDILFSTQAVGRVDRVLIDLCDYLWHCSAIGSKEAGKPPWFFKSTCYPPEEFKKKGHQVSVRWRRFSPVVAEAYDTHGGVVVAKHLTPKDKEEGARQMGGKR